MINEQKMDEKLMELGYADNIRGTRYLRTAVRIYDQDNNATMTKEIYPAVAKIHGTTASRVERGIRHANQRACERAGVEYVRRFYANSIGRYPTNGEVIARMARAFHED